jgi:hypothetical protein
VRPQYEAGAIYDDFDFFFGAFFFLLAMMVFLDAWVINLRQGWFSQVDLDLGP